MTCHLSEWCVLTNVVVIILSVTNCEPYEPGLLCFSSMLEKSKWKKRLPIILVAMPSGLHVPHSESEEYIRHRQQSTQLGESTLKLMEKSLKV